MECLAEREADRGPFDLGRFDVAEVPLQLTDVEIGVEGAVTPMRFLAQFFEGRHHAALPLSSSINSEHCCLVSFRRSGSRKRPAICCGVTPR
ncbi:hypothetical protein SDC9_206971 [bioreactor metagenome]|uniref:Uncharacterized protein n=1 Tax=bioreactor metagenome TaxID=1076179 RepID=A0A645J7X9_9ZZZZ